MHGWSSSVIDEKDGRVIDLCNEYCPDHIKRETNGYISKDSDKGFCKLDAFHTDNHHFECQNDHSTLDSYQGIDICFVIDTTGSMARYFEQVKVTINRIIKENQTRLKKVKPKCDFRFAIVDYRDHPSEADYLVHACDFTDDSTALNYLANLKSGSGGDVPEAVLDGLDRACELKWRSNADRLLFHILDAPPDGKMYTNRDDKWPDGCPCNKTSQNVLQKMKTKKIAYHILPCSNEINMMITEFKNHINIKILNFDDTISFESVITRQIHQQLVDTELTLKRN